MILASALAVTASNVPAAFTAKQVGEIHNQVRRYSSSYSSGSTYTSGGTAATAKKIVQTIKFTLASAAAYTGNVKTSYELGYGHRLGLTNTAGTAFATDCSVSSKVVTRRAEVSVEFTALASKEKANVAVSSATGLTSAGLIASINTVVAAKGYTDVGSPTVNSIGAATTSDSTVANGATKASLTTFAALFVGFAMFMHRN